MNLFSAVRRPPARACGGVCERRRQARAGEVEGAGHGGPRRGRGGSTPHRGASAAAARRNPCPGLSPCLKTTRSGAAAKAPPISRAHVPAKAPCPIRDGGTVGRQEHAPLKES